jgi:hypothetical protein
MPLSLRLGRDIPVVLLLAALASLLSSGSLRISSEPDQAVRRYTRSAEFDFVGWTVDALGVKLAQASLGTPFYFEADTRHTIVLDFLVLTEQVLGGEYQLSLIYSDPSVQDPAAASADLRLELAGLYDRQRLLAPLAEAILQEQVSEILADLGLTLGGRPVPPVLFHLTPLPYNLIVSPRDRIQADASISLVPDLPLDQQAALEERVDAGLNASSLVVPVGGLGSYPTMIMRTTALDWLANTIAHEWTHNWLSLRPLGIRYDSSAELRTMNETAASIAGSEISEIVMRRYYPERTAVDAVRTLGLGGGPPAAPSAGFDFRAEMHATRVRVDELLAAGRIEEAEAYMQARRQLFWDNGYPIRKLNQAYFAFYGAYADVPGGPAGEDPVGPAVRKLREQCSSLTEFLRSIGRMSTFEQLQAAISP